MDPPPVPLAGNSIQSSANPQVYGGSVTFTATLVGDSTNGPPTGTVDFVSNGTDLLCDNAAVTPGGGANTARATCVITAGAAPAPIGVGSFVVVSQYSGDGNYTAGDAAPLSQGVSKASTTTAVTQLAGPNPSTFGSSVTFQAAVAAVAPGAGIPTGTAQFLSDGAAIGSCTAQALDGSGHATCATAALTGGSHAITAAYSSDATFNASNNSAAALSHTVSALATSNGLGSSDTTTVVGESVTFTATVSSTSGTPTGTVAFKDGTTTITGCGAVALDLSGHAGCTTTGIAAGARSITAVYAGSSDYATGTSAPVTQTVATAATTTGLVSNHPTIVNRQSVTFTATVVTTAPGAGTPVGSVTFMSGGTPLGTVALNGSGVASLPTSALEAGMQNITAQYGGSSSSTPSTSAVRAQQVEPRPTATTLRSSGSPSVHGDAVTFTARVRALAPGGGVPTGTDGVLPDPSGQHPTLDRQRDAGQRRRDDDDAATCPSAPRASPPCTAAAPTTSPPRPPATSASLATAEGHR